MLAVVFGLSKIVEVSDAPEVAPRAITPVVAVQAASTQAAGLSGEPLSEGAAAVF